MRRSIITALLLVVCLNCVVAQDIIGTWGSNYAGVSSTFQNPALMANSKLYADINLIGVNLGYYHNDFYLEQEDSYVYEFLHKTKMTLLNGPLFPKQTAKTNYYRNNEPDFAKAYVNSRELGPSAMLNIGRNAFALSFSFRQSLSFNQVPDAVANLTKRGVAENELIVHGAYHILQPMRVAGLAWGETAFSYARILKSDGLDLMTLGGSFKLLNGVGGGYMYINNIDFSMLNRDLLNINSSSAQMGFSFPVQYDNGNSNVTYTPNYLSGKGFGLDLGFTMQRNLSHHSIERYTRLCEQEFVDYDYRFGVSLLDWGYIKFKDNAMSGNLQNSKPIQYDLRNFVFSSTQQAIDTINFHYNPKDTSIVKQKFNVLLPTALSVQYDKRITDHIYVTGVAVLGIPLGHNAVRRPSQFALVPRYESNIFELGMPLSMYEFAKPRLGLSARIFFLTVGTDRLISLGGVHDYFGYDFYASIRLNFMKIFGINYIKGECSESSSHPCF